MNKYTGSKGNKLINIKDIKEELFPIEESDTDFITKTGQVYKLYHDDMYFHKKEYMRKPNDYIYVSINNREKGNIPRRLHVLLAKTFINNPNPTYYKIVGHLDNNKTNYNLENLYWTTNQENVQKAVDDGLVFHKKGINSTYSNPVAVYNYDNSLIAVYGSIRECSRYIKNISESVIARNIKNTYKNRTKKYIYKACTIEFYNQNKDKQNIILEESYTSRQIKIFSITNVKNKYTIILDNQKTASKITDIPQASISRILKKNTSTIYKNWVFNNLGNIEFKNSSAYKNMIKAGYTYILKNINTNELFFYDTLQQIKDIYNIQGNNLQEYIKTGGILLNKWKIFKILNHKENIVA